MVSTNERVFHGPRVIGTSDIKVTATSVDEQWKQGGVFFSKRENMECLISAIEHETSVKREFYMECRTGVDYGYTKDGPLPRLQTLYNKAQEEGLILGTPRLVYALSLRRTHPLRAGQACIVAMKPLSDEQGHLYVPHIQCVRGQGGVVTTKVRLVGGDPFNYLSRTFPVLFFRPVAP